MAVRMRFILILGGLLLAPACAQVLGVQEVSDGPGGAGTSSSASSTGSSGQASSSSTGSTSSSTGSTSSSTGSTSSSSSSSSSGSSGSACALSSASCSACITCMEMGACLSDYQACDGGYSCSGFLDCEANCGQGGGFAACAVGPGGCAKTADTDPGYTMLKTCACGGCAAACPALCK
jgi:mannan endo-1,4-beta-mannosidase